MSKLCINAQVNPLSMGQITIALIREVLRQKLDISLFLRGEQNPETEGDAEAIKRAIGELAVHSELNHSYKDSFELDIWHLNTTALSRLSERKSLLSFYELDSPTKMELNVAKNQDILYFSSQYSCDVFENAGADNVKYLPLFFDSVNFKTLNKKYFSDDRVSFNLAGKFENRKHHKKIIQAWAKKYGNNKKYYLNCALYNTFLSNDDNRKSIVEALNGESYFNINFLSRMPTNAIYNDYLNSSNIMIGMSGGEGWGLPEFQSVALGKHSVILNAHGYKGWATNENSVLVEPWGKTSSEDGVFFAPNRPTNQGQLFDWKEDDFIDGCEEAIKRVESDPVNHEGLKLQQEFTTEKTLSIIMKDMS
tara:strand:+ start:3269 stop:4360 length:1092 start_codon:yes stop_codon:yes gene_type:complete